MAEQVRAERYDEPQRGRERPAEGESEVPDARRCESRCK